MDGRPSRVLLGLLALVVLAAPPAWSQPAPAADLQKQVDALSETVKAMQRDIQDIKALLQGRAPVAPAAPAENVVIDLRDNPSRGEPTARLTLVEFSDYQ